MIMNFARSIFESYETKSLRKHNQINAETHPIIDVIRLLGRKLQTEYLLNLLYCEDESPLERIEYDEVFFETKFPITQDGKFFKEIISEITSDKNIKLGRDLLLPWPWKRNRLISCITNIGRGRIGGEWKQDKNNHYTELWLPIGIAWVNGGNHSISTGIIQGEGIIKPTYVYDISKIYEHIYTDGKNYKRVIDDSIISPVRNIEFAAIFEIGRIMKDKQISF